MRKLNLASKSSRITNMNIPQLSVQLPQFTSMIELPKDISTIINLLGINLFHSPALFTQLCRLFTKHIQLILTDLKLNNGDITVDKMKEMETIALQPICDILSTIMLPSLSAGDSNAFLSSQLWTVLTLLPFDVRFRFYDTWKGNKTGKEAIGFKRNDQVLGETKALYYTRFHLKRLAKENTKVIGRSIGRYSNTCPIVCYTYILSQIESFDNLIPFVVDSIKHSTPLARDCMAYCLIIQLQKEDGKLKKGDTHYSSWFSSLAKFIGTFYRKYPNTELKGLFHFILDKLSKGETLDLLVLKELLVRMGGMETLMEVSQTQLEGLSGGRVLRSEVMNIGGEALSKKAMNALRDELMSSNTALPMLLFIAQVKSKILYNTETTQLKLISYLFDTCQEVLMQFTEFLVAGSKSIEVIAKLMPSFSSMINEIGLAIPVAFQLVRPIVRAALQCGEEPTNSPEYLQKWHPYSNEMKSVITTHLPEELWNYMSPELYITFWSLSLYDIRIPAARYELERKRLRERYTDLDTSRSTSTYTTVSEAEKGNRVRKVEMTKILNTIKDLTDEQETQKKHMEWTRKMLFTRKDSYFSNVSSENISGIIDNIMQNCIYDRVRMNPLDSVYCNQFFLTLHELDTPGFYTINYLDKMIKIITPLIFSTTEAESSFIGYAIADVMATIK
jgi:THO complex subunit 2